jgi:hypothetical protein
LNSVSGGLPTRRYGRKFEEVMKSAQDATDLGIGSHLCRFICNWRGGFVSRLLAAAVGIE